MVFFQCLFQCSTEIADQTAADTAGVHLCYLNTCILHKSAVNADFAEFIFNQHQLFVLICLAEHFFDQCGFSGSQESGKNINLGHFFIPIFIQ